jgi:hypothetical protein
MLIRRTSGTESAQSARHVRGFGGHRWAHAAERPTQARRAALPRADTSAGLDQPDGVDYEPDSLVFRWSGPKVAVIVELEPHPEAA